jgi:hypothetical protein
MSEHHWIPGRVLTDEEEFHVFDFNHFSLAVILSLSTSIRGNFLSRSGYFFLSDGNKRAENVKKREKNG